MRRKSFSGVEINIDRALASMIGAIVGHMIGIQLMYKSFNEIDDDMVDRAMNIG